MPVYRLRRMHRISELPASQERAAITKAGADLSKVIREVMKRAISNNGGSV